MIFPYRLRAPIYARRALKKFVDEQMQEGDLVAIIRTGGGIGALQQFTTDKRQLYAAIDKVRWNPTGTGQIGTFGPMEAKPDALPTPDGDTGGTPADPQGQLESFRERFCYRHARRDQLRCPRHAGTPRT